MATRQRIPGPLGFIYNVDQPVGLGCPNRTDDVLLVQVLLKRFFELQASARPPGPPLVVNGCFDPTTFYWVVHLQYIVSSAGLTVDGRVDPAHGGSTPHHHRAYTIFYLND